MIEKRQTTKSGVRWEVRLRGPDGRERSRTFRTRRDAEVYERDQLRKRDRGEWTDPAAARQRFADWAARWLDSNPTKRAKTLYDDRTVVERHLNPAFGSQPLGTIEPGSVQRFVNEQARRYRPTTVRRHYAVLRAIFNAAVDDDLIGRSPCRQSTKLPAVEQRDRYQLTPADVAALITATEEPHRLVIRLLAETGLRISEVAGLRVGRLALLGSNPTLTVAEAATEAGGKLHSGPPKSRAGRRTIALSSGLRDELAAHLALSGLNAADGIRHVFTNPTGTQLRANNFRARVLAPALERAGLAGLGLGLHDLRRFAATQMLAGGVDVRTAQGRLGHSDPRLTLAIYAQVTPAGDRAAAAALAALLDDLPQSSEADHG
jgi:integrase